MTDDMWGDCVKNPDGERARVNIKRIQFKCRDDGAHFIKSLSQGDFENHEGMRQMFIKQIGWLNQQKEDGRLEGDYWIIPHEEKSEIHYYFEYKNDAMMFRIGGM